MKNELINVGCENAARYDEFAELLCKRDQLDKEAESVWIRYLLEFGDEITTNFGLKIECIRKKKEISFCQSQINKGLKPEIPVMDDFIKNLMKTYYDDLDDMMRRNKRAKDSTTVSEFKVQRSKKIYRRIAKLIHPDMNKKTAENPELSALWEKVTVAYHHSDPEELENLELLLYHMMDDLGKEGFSAVFSDIEERIERVEMQISEILSSEPYVFKELLGNPDKILAKHEELSKEHEEYTNYLCELKETLETLLNDKGASLIWIMN